MNSTTSTGGYYALCLLALLTLQHEFVVKAQSAIPTYKGRPFVLISRNNVFLPSIGVNQGFYASQLIGDSVAFVTRNTSFKGNGIFIGNGSDPDLVAAQGMSLPGFDYSPTEIGITLASNHAAENNLAFVIIGANAQTSIVRRDADSTLVQVVSETDLMPESGGLHFTGFGEPNISGNRIAFIGLNQSTAESRQFRGLYLWTDEHLIRIADPNTTIENFGQAKPLSSQVGFDGETMVYWGGNDDETSEGIFAVTDEGNIEVIASKGNSIPGTAFVMDRFQSPPAVQNGAIYFVAITSENRAYLVKGEAGALTTIAGYQEASPSGGTFDQIGASGLVATGGLVYFSSYTSAADHGIYVCDGQNIETVVDQKTHLFGNQTADNFILRDADNEHVLIEAISNFGQNATLHATLTNPGTPIIIEAHQPVTVNLGETARFEAKVAGPSDMMLQWYFENAPIPGANSAILEISNVAAENSGDYNLHLTANGATQTTGGVPLILNIAPEIRTDIDDGVFEAGTNIVLRVEVAGAQPLQYQWFHNNTPIPDQTTFRLILAGALPDLSGTYHVEITNDLGTVSSRMAQIEVTPPPPNPSFNGKRFEPIFVPGEAIPGVTGDATVQSTNYSPNATGLAISLTLTGNTEATVAATLGKDGIVKKLTSISDINETLGTTFTGFGAAPILNPSNQGYYIIASEAFVPKALISIQGNEVSTVINESSLLSDQTGITVVPAAIHHVAADGSFIFRGIANERAGLYRWKNDDITTLIDQTITLPDGFGDGAQVNMAGYHDDTLYFNKLVFGFPQDSGLFSLSPDGNIQLIARQGDAIEGSNETINSVSTVKAANGRLYGVVFSSSFATLITELSNDGLQASIETGIEVSGGGVLTRIEAATTFGGSAPLFLSAQVQVPGIDGRVTNTSGVFQWSDEQLTPILRGARLDGLRVNGFSLLSIDQNDDTLFASVNRAGQSGVVYANVSEGDAPLPTESPSAPTLAIPTVLGTTLQFSVPTGFALEASEQILAPIWNAGPLPNQGTVTIEIEDREQAQFFRLIQIR